MSSTSCLTPASSSQELTDSDLVLSKLDQVIDEIQDEITLGRPPSIILYLNDANDSRFDVTTQRLRAGTRKRQVVKYTSPRFPILLAVISYIYQAISDKVILSKRDIYYRDVALFKTQNVVDQVIEQLAQTLDMPRHLLNIEAAAKGLVRGPLKLIAKDCTIDCSVSDHLISSIDFDDCELDCHAIVIVEKEAIFRTLGSLKLPYLFITGKGYILTRRFLAFLKDCCRDSHSPMMQSMPFLALVDYDPHGIEILATYRFGSAANSIQSDALALVDLKWLGVHQADIGSGVAKVLPFSVSDHHKLRTLGCKPWLDATNNAGSWRDEIIRMQTAGVKAEIEVLCDHNGGLAAYITRKITQHEWL